jgi:ABC-2 type transport system permease protein
VAVTAAPAPTFATPSIRHFVRLKLRVTANGLRGSGWRVTLFVVGVWIAVCLAFAGFMLFALPGLTGSVNGAGMAAGLGGSLLVLGWLFLPLVFFGVDESLDPARFALLPLSRRTLVTGLFAAAVTGVPAVATLLASIGMVFSAASLGGFGAALAAAVGVVAGLLLCVVVSRAVTSAFATALRSRRARDLAAILLAVLAALLGPVQVLVLHSAKDADWGRLATIGRVLGWTPLAAPYTLGQDVVEGRAWAVPVKLLITVAAIAALLWWWSASLEAALPGGATQQLFAGPLSWLPRNRFGALVAREAHYWWRETRRRANLITFSVVGVFLPVMVNLGSDGPEAGAPSLTATSGALLFVGVLAAISLANQFGFEASAYAANIIAGVPGRVELQSRVLGFTLYLGPLMAAIAVIVGIVVGEAAWIPALIGMVVASFGVGLAMVLPVSVYGAYALPDTTNPFAISSGAGVSKGFLSLLAIIVGGLSAAPVLVASWLIGDAWVWLGLPIGVAYGALGMLIGVRLGGRALDRRMPELLAAVTPNR